MSSYFVRRKGAHLTIYRHESVDGKRKQFYVPKHLWQSLGVYDDKDEAAMKAAVSRLNKEGNLKRKAKTQEQALKNLNEIVVVKSVFLPEEEVRAFVEDFKDKSFGSEMHVSKLLSHWVTVQEIIAELRLQPADYSQSRHKVYRAMAKRKYSPSYVQRLIRILNDWGRFVSRAKGLYFEAVPAPRAEALTLVKEQYQQSAFNRDGGSTPLTPETIMKLADKIPWPQLSWLKLSLYFGLRPIEVESLRKAKNYKIEFDKHEVPVLHVYQSKLRHHSGQAWKAIPCILEEQRELLEVIQAGDFIRPLARTLKGITGDERLTLYAGRKGFTDLMLERDQKLEHVSQWLGHSQVDRTWKHYKDKNRVAWTPIKKA